VILLDENDKEIGHASKKDSHLMTNIEKGMLHRAFSVFLFNSKNELLLQQRSDEKITFPKLWTNTCCSHPLYRDAERVDGDAVGVKAAAVRKLEHELGITDITVDDLHWLTRIHYKAPCHGQWGEHEIDYVLFAKKDVTVAAVANEVKAVKWVSLDGMKQACIDGKEGKTDAITPWCQMITDKFLYSWWKDLDTIIARGGGEFIGAACTLCLALSPLFCHLLIMISLIPRARTLTLTTTHTSTTTTRATQRNATQRRHC
jgi:isopentenyl-diphosphate delta-isomerase